MLTRCRPSSPRALATGPPPSAAGCPCLVRSARSVAIAAGGAQSFTDRHKARVPRIAKIGSPMSPIPDTLSRTGCRLLAHFPRAGRNADMSVRWGIPTVPWPSRTGKVDRVPRRREPSAKGVISPGQLSIGREAGARMRDLVLAMLWAAPRRRGEDRALPRGEHWPRDRSPACPEGAGLGPDGRRSLPQETRSPLGPRR